MARQRLSAPSRPLQPLRHRQSTGGASAASSGSRSMSNASEQLLKAVAEGDARAVKAALAAGADADANVVEEGGTVLHFACGVASDDSAGYVSCVQALLEHGASPHVVLSNRATPLHLAAISGSVACIEALLAAGADPMAMGGNSSWNALHRAAGEGQTAAVWVLLQAAPAAALAKLTSGETPLTLALVSGHFIAARCLLEHGCLPPACDVLAELQAARSFPKAEAAFRYHPLYVALVARLALTPAEWERVPAPCPGLGSVLPAVLARSEAEAAQLVRRLAPAKRERLRVAALCLRRAHCWQRRRRVYLPGDIVRRVLALAVAD